jgi:predicted phosphohydrolase
MIAGNHEHYRMAFEKTHARMRKELPDNFRIMENDCFELDNVLFVGATLWTDMNRGDPLTVHAVKHGMNDFEVIKKIRTPTEYVRFTPHDAINEHVRSLQYFKIILDNPHNIDKTVVMITHHAPTGQSVDNRYRDQFLMNGGYHSRLDDFILDNPRIKYWIHGHVHSVMDYMVGDYTRVLCNPRGYQSSYGTEMTGWNPDAHFIL